MNESVEHTSSNLIETVSVNKLNKLDENGKIEDDVLDLQEEISSEENCEEMESLIIEEFGRCLLNIIDLADLNMNSQLL